MPQTVFDEMLVELKNAQAKQALGAIQDPEARKELEQYFLRQRDYDQKVASFQQAQERLRQLEQLSERWNNFYANGQPQEWQKRYQEYPQLAQEKQRLENELAQARAEAEATRAAAAATPEGEQPAPLDVNKILDAGKGRFVSREEAQRMADEAAQRAVYHVNNVTAPNVIELQNLANRAKDELGERIPEALLADAAQRAGSLAAGYDMLTREKYAAKQRNEWEAQKKQEIDAALAAERGKLEEERRKFQTHTFVPEDASGFQAQFGPLQKEITKDTGELPNDYVYGSGVLGARAAKDYREGLSQGLWKE